LSRSLADQKGEKRSGKLRIAFPPRKHHGKAEAKRGRVDILPRMRINPASTTRFTLNERQISRMMDAARKEVHYTATLVKVEHRSCQVGDHQSLF